MGAAASALRGTPLSAPLGTGIRPRPPRCTGSARGVPVVQPLVPRDTVAREIDAQPTWTPPRPHDAVWCAGSALEQRGHGSAPTPPALINAVHSQMALAPSRNVRAAPHATEQQNALARECGRPLATPTPPPRIFRSLLTHPTSGGPPGAESLCLHPHMTMFAARALACAHARKY